jgi:hypothetical protein
MSRGVTIALAVAGALRATSPVVACSVCFGDPDSPLAKGALMGVYVLVGVVGFVLLSIAATGVYWIQRSRRLTRGDEWDTTNPQ